jgi:monovalent cation:H+ antiporter-2, CPA2 family
VSFALGAFFAGMILAESPLSQQAAQETLPLRDAFAVLFFVSVGMLFDPAILVRMPGPVAATVLIIVVGNALAVFSITIAFRYSLRTALTMAAALSQIGEFSFILAGLGVSLALLPAEGQDLILAGALLSILVNPVLFVVLDRLGPRLKAREERLRPDEPAAAPAIPELPVTALTGHTVLVGYGRVGSLIGAALRDRGEPFLVIEEREGTARHLREEGVEVILGNAGQHGLLAAANLGRAKCLVSAIPNPFEASTLIEAARSASPGIEIVARAHSDAEVEHLQKFGANRIVLGELEIAREMARFLFREQGAFEAFDRADLAPDGDAFERAQVGSGARERAGEPHESGGENGGLTGLQAAAGADAPR